MSGSVDMTFTFSVGIKEQMAVKKGFLKDVKAHLERVVVKLGFVVSRKEPSDLYPHGTAYWYLPRDVEKELDGELYCRIAMDHAAWLEYVTEDLRRWSKEPPKGETELLRPEDCVEFWYGLSQIHVPFEKWSREYFIWRMEAAYAFLRGYEVEGHSANGMKPLSIEQANTVIWMMAELLHLDRHDVRMEAPKKWRRVRKSVGGRGRMVLKQTDMLEPCDGHNGEGYAFCESCGPVVQEYGSTGCPRRKCPLREEL
ncbi:MAG TPA: hypothetical protein PLA94_25375 [Myxococcota bacterium]|nr:hypothetical protein [Myxococcota bacterium]